MRSGISVKGYIEYINGIVEEHGLKNVSMILNGLPASKHSSYGYSKYGYSNYGKCGYTEDDDDDNTGKGNFFSRLFGKKN